MEIKKTFTELETGIDKLSLTMNTLKDLGFTNKELDKITMTQGIKIVIKLTEFCNEVKEMIK